MNESFVEIESADPVESDEEVLIVASNMWGALPLEFKDPIPKSDTERCATLRTAVASWARVNGFLQIEA
jgi:hypothetical protein